MKTIQKNVVVDKSVLFLDTNLNHVSFLDSALLFSSFCFFTQQKGVTMQCGRLKVKIICKRGIQELRTHELTYGCCYFFLKHIGKKKKRQAFSCAECFRQRGRSDEVLIRVVGHTQGTKRPGGESGRMQSLSLLEVLRLPKHFFMLLCFCFSVPFESDDLDRNSYLIFLQDSDQTFFLSSNTLTYTFLGALCIHMSC